MSKTKEKLLREFDEYLSNERCCIIDIELSDEPLLEKAKVVQDMNTRYMELYRFRKVLENILNS